jgi:transposase
MRALTPEQQHRAGELHGRGLSRAEIAAVFGVSERTITRVLKLPDIQRVAQDTEQELRDPTAAGTLRELLTHSKASIRLNAARALLANPDAEVESNDVNAGPRITVIGALPDE